VGAEEQTQGSEDRETNLERGELQEQGNWADSRILFMDGNPI
jgi:hypothetical protein